MADRVLRTFGYRWLALVLSALVVVGSPLSATRASAGDRATFAIDYIVSISEKDPTRATVRWELAGGEEIKVFRMHFPAGTSDIRSSGILDTQEDGEVHWSPAAPYGHLMYSVPIPHRRGQQQRFDSYATSSWIVTRARQLFPRTRVDLFPRDNLVARSRSRLIFRLPRGWQSATALPAIGPHTYRVFLPDRPLSMPRGWFVLGHFEITRQEIAEIMLQFARVPGGTISPPEVFTFLEATLPSLRRLLNSEPETILIVAAPDPMWRGGISGERSFFVHSERPLRTPDRTSPYLHELFHVMQPFRAGPDADWIIEGLAEFYSLELQRRAGLISDRSFGKALASFEKFGLWNVDLRAQQDNAATNNSAPLVLYALDQRIQRATAGKKRLDDVVAVLAREKGVVNSTRFQSLVAEMTGRKLNKFFDRHVVRGEAPSLKDWQ